MKLNTAKLGLLALSLFSFSLAMSAQEKKAPNFDKMFKRYDADTDGSISLEEYKSTKRKKEVPVERLEKSFAKLDGNSDGAVTLEELKANFGKGKGKSKGKGKKN